jgi:hypothetical protein
MLYGEIKIYDNINIYILWLNIQLYKNNIYYIILIQISITRKLNKF